MKIKDYKMTQKFSSSTMAYDYLEYLGAREMEAYLDGKKTKFYVLGNVILKYDPEYRSLFIHNDLPSEIDSKIKSYQLQSYFYGHNILNLEGLVFLYALLTSSDEEVEKKYNETLREMQLYAIDKEKSYYHKTFNSCNEQRKNKRILSEPMAPDIVFEFDDAINRLIKTIYPFTNHSFIDNADKFIESETKYSLESGYNNYGKCIRFSFSFDYEDKTIECSYNQNLENVNVFVGIKNNTTDCYDFIGYNLGTIDEKITFTTFDQSGKNFTLYVKNNIVVKNNKSLIATTEEYNKIIAIINSFTDEIIKAFPYLDPEKETTRKK
jgi:hypothetical protein